MSSLSFALVELIHIKWTNHFCSHHTLFPVCSWVPSTSSRSSLIWNASQSFSPNHDILCKNSTFHETNIHPWTLTLIRAQVFLLWRFVRSETDIFSGFFSKYMSSTCQPNIPWNQTAFESRFVNFTDTTGSWISDNISKSYLLFNDGANTNLKEGYFNTTSND